jgi:hypothetical protein
MKLNMGSFDRGFRLFIALLIVILFFTNIITGTLGIVLLVFAGVFLLTSIFGFCPVYALLGLNTCPRLKH